MNALSVVENAGDLIASGKKTLEIRQWVPADLPLINLAIVQNKKRLTTVNPFDPDGMIVAIVDVRSVRRWEPKDAQLACSEWQEGWLAWELDNIRKVIIPQPAPAKLRIYEISFSVEDLLEMKINA